MTPKKKLRQELLSKYTKGVLECEQITDESIHTFISQELYTRIENLLSRKELLMQSNDSSTKRRTIHLIREKFKLLDLKISSNSVANFICDRYVIDYEFRYLLYQFNDEDVEYLYPNLLINDLLFKIIQKKAIKLSFFSSNSSVEKGKRIWSEVEKNIDKILVKDRVNHLIYYQEVIKYYKRSFELACNYDNEKGNSADHELLKKILKVNYVNIRNFLLELILQSEKSNQIERVIGTLQEEKLDAIMNEMILLWKKME